MTTAQCLALGQRALEQDWLADARGAFEAAGDRDGLLAVAQRCLDKGQLAEAHEAFAAAGQPMTTAQCLALGQRALGQGMFADARGAFEAAGQPMTTAQCLAIGQKALEQGMLTDAYRAFEAAGDKDGLFAVARRCLEGGSVYGALVFLARKLALNSRGTFSVPAMHLLIPSMSIQTD